MHIHIRIHKIYIYIYIYVLFPVWCQLPACQKS